jgi:serine/threonine-protein kinase HipA
VADRLTAWLYGTPVADLARGPEFRIELTWLAVGLERWGLGSPALSTGLPIGSPTSPRDMRGMDFFENVLPEGATLARMASMAGVRTVDTYGILKAFGRDCAGALMVIPDGDKPGQEPASGYEPMTPDDLREVIGMLDVAPLAAAPERGFRPSLAGFQRKALLGRAADGTWQRPRGSEISGTFRGAARTPRTSLSRGWRGSSVRERAGTRQNRGSVATTMTVSPGHSTTYPSHGEYPPSLRRDLP